MYYDVIASPRLYRERGWRGKPGLVDEVAALTANGWEPVGGVVVVGEGAERFYLQTVVQLTEAERHERYGASANGRS